MSLAPINRPRRNFHERRYSLLNLVVVAYIYGVERTKRGERAI